MIRDGSTSRDEDVPQWKRRLRWSASGHGWFATTKDGTLICVSEETYERCLRAHLKRFGIERKTWTEMMQPAQEEWQRQCEAEHLFRSDLDYWLTCNCPGVQIIHQRNSDETG